MKTIEFPEPETMPEAPLAASTALCTDHYELTALSAALHSGVAYRAATFELFARVLPAGRRYGVVGGIGRLVGAIEAFRFGPAELDFLADLLDDDTLDYLAGWRFTGDIDAYAEGELYFPGSPVVSVRAPFGEAVVLETLALSVLNYDSAVASAAARMHAAAAGVPLIEAGSRRTHDRAAVAAARAAYVCGFDVTSNLEAGRTHSVPTAGTTMHAFILAHDTEETAFAAQYDTFGTDTTLLVDTYDLATAIRTGVRLANERGATGPAGIRIDSGDLATRADCARVLLDCLGATRTRIAVSGDLDEHRIADLVASGAPIDRFMAGTALVTGSGAPTAGFVYKLVEIADADGIPCSVAKCSAAKAYIAGTKAAARALDASGAATAEIVTTDLAGLAVAVAAGHVRPLLTPLLRAGHIVADTSVATARAHHARVRAELTHSALSPAPGDPALRTITDLAAVPGAHLDSLTPREATM